MKIIRQLKISNYFKYGQNPIFFINMILGFYGVGVYLAKNNFWHSEHPFLVLSFTIVIALCFIWYKKIIGCVFLLLFMLCLGNIRGDMYFQLASNNVSNYLNQSGTLHGIIVDIPKITVEGDRRKITYVVLSEEFTNQNKISSKLQGKVYFYCHNKVNEPLGEVGQEIFATGRINSINTYGNPGVVNKELRAYGQGIYASFLADNRIIKLGQKAAGLFELQRLSFQIRNRVLNFFLENLPEEKAYMLYGMIFGGYNGLPRTTVDAFTGAGIVHMLAVSGTHIGMLAGFILILCNIFKLPVSGKIFILILILSMYGMLCGFKPSVLRAILMGLMAVIGVSLGKERDGKNILSITALIILLFNPLLMYDISFQLSFAAAAGLIYLMQPISNLLKGLNVYIRDSLALTIAVQIATAPILAWYFNNLTLVVFLSNLIVIPLLELAIVLGLNVIVLIFIWPYLGGLILEIINEILNVANYFIVGIAQLPYGSIYIKTFSGWFIAGYYFLMYLCLKAYVRKLAGKIIKQHSIMMLIFMVSLGIGIGYYYQQPKDLAIHFMDTKGEGKILVITPHGHSILIVNNNLKNSNEKDSSFDTNKAIILPYLRHYGVTSLDYLILMGGEAAYLDELNGILGKITINNLVINQDKNNISYDIKVNLSEKYVKKVVITNLEKGLIVDKLKIKYAKLVNNMEQQRGSQAINVVKLMYGNFKGILVKGQIKEKGFLQHGFAMKGDLLQIEENSVDTKVEELFYQTVNPRYVIVTSSKDNKATEDYLFKEKNNLYRIKEVGATICYTDGEKIAIKSYLGQ